MEIKHVHKAGLGGFIVEIDGRREAELVYKMQNNHVMIILHTEVNESLNGKGVGKQLVSAAVDYARNNQLKIIPQCPFAKVVFNKVADFNDVLLIQTDL